MSSSACRLKGRRRHRERAVLGRAAGAGAQREIGRRSPRRSESRGIAQVHHGRPACSLSAQARSLCSRSGAIRAPVQYAARSCGAAQRLPVSVLQRGGTARSSSPRRREREPTMNHLFQNMLLLFRLTAPRDVASGGLDNVTKVLSEPRAMPGRYEAPAGADRQRMRRDRLR